jgi:2-polyprenyl-3-methyl-5-hydroxy-6-metoxy-1,4-benzoquinol methylase
MNYQDKIFSKYVSGHLSHAYGNAYKEIESFKKQFPVWQKYFGKFLPEDKKIKIIDLGCGNGSFVYWLQVLGYQNVEGIDISEEQVALAKKIGIKNIQKADIFDYLKDKKETFDLIFTRDIIEHIRKEDVLKFLGIIFLSLKKGGGLVIQTPNAENLFFGRLRYIDFTHESGFTSNSLYQILTITGFREIKSYPAGPVIHGLKSFIRYILWKLIQLVIRFYLLVETGATQGIFTQSIITFAKK